MYVLIDEVHSSHCVIAIFYYLFVSLFDKLMDMMKYELSQDFMTS